MAEEITYQSQPDFDEWGWDSYWSPAEWLTWLNMLVEEYGSEIGAQKFYESWMSRTGALEALGDVRADWISFNTGGFRDAVRGFTLPNGKNLLKALQGSTPLSGVIGGASDVVDAAGDGLTDISAGIGRTTKTLSWVLPVLLIVAVLGGLTFLFYKSKILIK